MTQYKVTSFNDYIGYTEDIIGYDINLFRGFKGMEFHTRYIVKLSNPPHDNYKNQIKQ